MNGTLAHSLDYDDTHLPSVLHPSAAVVPAALAAAEISGATGRDLLAAIAAGDVARLSTIPGVGRKTADRMVLELREKMQELAAELPERPAAADQDVVSALVNLGYKTAQAERAVAEARRDRPTAGFGELLKASLNRLSRA
jgi:Holliday junction DNA helicase RuvA